MGNCSTSCLAGGGEDEVEIITTQEGNEPGP